MKNLICLVISITIFDYYYLIDGREVFKNYDAIQSPMKENIFKPTEY